MRTPLVAVALFAAGGAFAAPPAAPSAAPSAGMPAAASAGQADVKGAPSAGGKTGPEGKASPGPAPSQQGRELSRALVPQRTWEGLLDRSAESLSGAVARSLSARGEKVPGDLQSSLRKELGKSLKYEEAVDAQAQALQKRFTPQELEQAARFYESPLGKKMLQELPAAQGEVGDQLQERLASVVPDVIHRVAPSAMNNGPGAQSPGRSSPDTGTGAGADADTETGGGDAGSGTAAPPGGGGGEKAPPGKGL